MSVSKQDMRESSSDCPGTRLNGPAPLTIGNRSSCNEERLRGYLAVADGQLRAEDISDIETAGFEVSELRRKEMQACRI